MGQDLWKVEFTLLEGTRLSERALRFLKWFGEDDSTYIGGISEEELDEAVKGLTEEEKEELGPLIEAIRRVLKEDGPTTFAIG
jgi:hypothetical protein